MLTLSIIIPSYNRVAELSGCLRSILQQDHMPTFEVIVVDDGSTDDIRAVTASCGGDVVRYVRQENAGPCRARNRGSRLATGRFLVFLDSDDELAAGWGQSMQDLLTNEEVALVSGGVLLRDAQSGARREIPPASLGPAYGDLVASLLPGSYAIRREIFAALGGFAEDIDYGEHHELGIRLTRSLSLDTSQARAVSQPIVIKHHDRGPDVTASYHRRRVDSVERMVDRHGDRFAADRALLSDYEGVAAYSAASLGEFRRARRHYMRAGRAAPWRPKPYLGVALTLIPVARERFWLESTSRGRAQRRSAPVER